jgi:hypothetical protein
MYVMIYTNLIYVIYLYSFLYYYKSIANEGLELSLHELPCLPVEFTSYELILDSMKWLGMLLLLLYMVYYELILYIQI